MNGQAAVAGDRRVWGRLNSWIDGLGAVDLILRFSLIAMVVASHHHVPAMVVSAVVAVVVLSRPVLLHHPVTWMAGAAALLVWQVPRWHTFDNHVLLTTYWVAAVALCLLTTDPGASLRFDGRWMIGIIFGLGAAWKLGSPDFRSGGFFEYSLLQDSRFAFVADWFGGVDEATRQANRDAVQSLVAEPERWVTLRSAPGIRWVALVFTWWGILVESVVALAWLLPLRQRWRWIRHVSLVGFIATTYAVVPVGGFGCLLVAMALTQADDRPGLRAVYGCVFGLLLVYGPVWGALFAR